MAVLGTTRCYMKLSELVSVRPGSIVDVLCVVLGVEGPRAYNTADGGSSFYARVQVADATASSGVPLLFFGPSAHRVLSFRPFLPIYFSQLTVKPPDRYGVISLAWCASRSSLNRNPGQTVALRALEAWSNDEFGPLAGAARDGFVKGQCNPYSGFDYMSRTFCKPRLRSDEPSENQRIGPRALLEQRRDLYVPDEPGTIAAVRSEVCLHRHQPERVHIHDSGHLKVARNLSDMTHSDSQYLMRLRVLAAKFPMRSRKRRHSPKTLTPLLIRSLVRGGCEHGCNAGATWRCPELHLAGCRQESYGTFWLRVEDEDSKRGVVAVTGIVGERIMLGVRAQDVRSCHDSGQRAVRAIFALLREQGPFDAIVSTSCNSFSGQEGDSVSRGRPAGVPRLLQMFV